MPIPQRKSLDHPDELREFPHGMDAVVSIAGRSIGRAEFRPGWRWSNDVRPVAGTASCQVHHVGYLLCGVLHVETDDGAGVDLVAGDAFEIMPGHDAWVVGDDVCRMLDWSSGAAGYAVERDGASAGAGS